MCRILGYLGAPVALDEILFAPPAGLEHQSHAPRFQTLGHLNADGWGVGWYDAAVRPEPARYRTVTPMWADQRFRDVAPLVRSRCVLASVRNASPGAPIDESGNAPFTAGRYLFSHNGYVEGFRTGLGERLRREVSVTRAAGILGAADSEVLFAMVLDHLDAGASMVDALTAVLAAITAHADGAYNLQLSDGETIVSTRWGNSLFTATREDVGGLVVASEPWDDDGSWDEVPDRSLVVTTGDGFQVSTL